MAVTARAPLYVGELMKPKPVRARRCPRCLSLFARRRAGRFSQVCEDELAANVEARAGGPLS